MAIRPCQRTKRPWDQPDTVIDIHSYTHAYTHKRAEQEKGCPISEKKPRHEKKAEEETQYGLSGTTAAAAVLLCAALLWWTLDRRVFCTQYFARKIHVIYGMRSLSKVRSMYAGAYAEGGGLQRLKPPSPNLDPGDF